MTDPTTRGVVESAFVVFVALSLVFSAGGTGIAFAEPTTSNAASTDAAMSSYTNDTTMTPEPTSTPTSEPTSTPTPEPTSTSTPEPTSTPTPEPTSTPTPEPTSTSTSDSGTDSGSTFDACREFNSSIYIDEPGCYVLTESVANATADAFVTVNASDVVIDAQNHAVDGADGASHVVFADGVSNVTVRNLTTTGYDEPIYFQNVADGAIRNVDVENAAVGISLVDSGNVTVSQSSVVGAFQNGVRLERTNASTVTATTVTNAGGTGLFLYDSADNRFESVEIAGAHVGVRTVDSGNNAFLGGAVTATMLSYEGSSLTGGVAGNVVTNVSLNGSSPLSFEAHNVSVAPASDPTSERFHPNVTPTFRVNNTTDTPGYLDVTFTYSEGAIPKNSTESSVDVWAYRSDSDSTIRSWRPVDGSTLNAGANTVAANVTVDEWTGVAARVDLPNADVSGQILRADGTALSNDLVFARNRSSRATFFGPVNRTGAYAVEVAPNRTYTLGLVQVNESSTSFEIGEADGAPDIFALEHVGVDAEDVSLDTRTLPPAYPVNVTVRSESGSPVENASVFVTHYDAATGAKLRTPIQFSTDADGSLRQAPSDGLELAGNVTFTVYPPVGDDRYETSTRTLNVTTANASERNVTITLDESSSDDGTAAPDASRSVDADNDTVAPGETVNVTVSVPVESNVSNLTIEEYYPTSVVTAATVTDVNFDGNATVETAADGTVRAAFENVSAGTTVALSYRLTVDEAATPGSAFELFGIVARDGDVTYTYTSDTTLTVAGGTPITGRLVDESGAPRTFETVLVSPVGDRGDFRGIETNDTGDFALDVVPNATYDVIYRQWMPGNGIPDVYVLERVTVNDSSVSLANLTVPANASVVNVTVVDENGDPVPNARVHPKHQPPWAPDNGLSPVVYTNADGMAQFEEQPPGIDLVGNVSLLVRPPENAPRFADERYVRSLNVTADDNVTIPLNETAPFDATREVEPTPVEPGETLTVNVTVFAETNQSELTISDRYPSEFVENATVIGIDVDGEADAFAPFVENDTVVAEFENLTAGTTVELMYAVTVREDVASETTFELTGTVSNGDMTVETPEETVTVTERTADVTGTIREADGDPAVDDTVAVFAEGPNGTTTVVTTVTTNETGAFLVEVAPNATYTLGYYQFRSYNDIVPSDGSPDVYGFARTNVTGDVDFGNLTLPPARVVNITVVDASGDPVENASVWVGHDNTANGAGAAWRARTSEAGLIFDEDGVPGAELAGNATLDVIPPENDSRFVDETYHYELNATTANASERNITVALQEYVNVTGELDTYDGSPADNDTLVFANETVDSSKGQVVVRTDADGVFEARLLSGVTYRTLYYQWLGENGSDVAFPRDGSPDVLPLDSGRATDDTDLGPATLPRANVVNVTVVDEAGTPVSNATVDVGFRYGEETVRPLTGLPTSEAGVILDGTGSAPLSDAVDPAPGIELAGNVTLEIAPPENDSRFVDETYTRTLNATTANASERNVTVVLEEYSVIQNLEGRDGDMSTTDLRGAFSMWATGDLSTRVVWMATFEWVEDGPTTTASLDASRTVETTVLRPGASTNVTLTVDVSNGTAERLIVGDGVGVDDDTASISNVDVSTDAGTALAALTNATGVLASVENAENGTVELTYTLTVSPDATDGDTVTLSGGTAAKPTEVDAPNATIRVAEGSNFTANVTSANASVDVGETVTVEADVTNHGAGGTQTVSLSVDGVARDSRSLTLAPGATETVSLSWTTDVADAGVRTVTVSTANETRERRVDVVPDGYLSAAELPFVYAVNRTAVVSGAPVQVTATIANTRSETQSVDVPFVVDGVVSTRTVFVEPGETRQVSTTVAFETVGNHTVSVGDVSATTIEVRPRVVDATTTNRTVNGTVVTEHAVENVSAGAIYALDVAGGTNETAGASLDGIGFRLGRNASTVRVNTTAPTTAPPNGTPAAPSGVEAGLFFTAESNVDDGDIEEVAFVFSVDTTREPFASKDPSDVALYRLVDGTWTRLNTTYLGDGRFRAISPGFTLYSVGVTGVPNVTVTDYTVSPTSVQTGDSVTVTATVENTGTAEGTLEVPFYADGGQFTTRTATLAPGETTTVSATTSFASAGSHTVSVGDLATTTVSVSEPPEPPEPASFATSLSVNATDVLVDGDVRLTAIVENTGEQSGTTTLTFRADGGEIATREVSLAAGASRTVAVTTSFATAGAHTVSLNGGSERTVQVRDPASVDVSALSTDSPVTTGESLSVSATVENTGDVAATRTVSVAFDGGQVASREVSLAAGANRTLSFAVDTTGRSGAFTLAVSTGDDEATREVRVLTPAAFETSNVSVPSRALDGSSVPAGLTVANAGDVAGSTDVTLAVDGSVVERRTVSLSGGERTRVTFDLSTDGLAVGNHTVTFSAGGVETSRTLFVAETVPDVDVSTTALSFANASVGATTTETVTVRNTGTYPLNVTDLRIVGADADAFAVNATQAPFTLAPDTSRTVTVTFAPTAPATASATLEIESDDPDESVTDVSLAGTGTGAVVSLNAEALSYHSRSLDSRTNQTLLVTNDGNAALDVTGVEITGPDADAFTVVAGAAPFSVPAADAGEVTVQFAPTTAGEKRANLTIRTGDASTPAFTIPLSGSGKTPDVSVSATDLAFGEAGVGSSVTRNLTVTNDGSAPLSVDGVSVSGDAFAVVAGGDPVELVPGETRTVTVRFAPAAGGDAAGTLTVESDDPDEGNLTVSLAGTGLEPEIAASATAVDFGVVPAGSSSLQSVTVSNDGEAPLVVSNVTVSGPDADAFAPVGAASFRVAPGDQETVRVAFAPDAAENVTATLELASNDPDAGTVTVSLAGEGAESVVSAAPSTASFGAVEPNRTVTRTITLRNRGADPVTVERLELGGDTDVFALDSGGAPFTLAAEGGTHTVTVAFTPAATGDRAATLSAVDADGETRATVTLGGTGAAPDVALSTESVSFDDTRVGGTATATVIVENTGNAPLDVASLSLSGADADSFAARGAGIVAPGETRAVTVAFEPDVTGAFAATLAVESNDPDEPRRTVDLSGQSVTPIVGVSPESVGFGNVTVNSTTVREVTVRNAANASASVTVTGSAVVGPDASAYSVDVETPFTLAPGESRTLDVAFTPRTPGRQFGRLRLFTNDPATSQLDVFLSNTRTVIQVEPTAERDGTRGANVTVRNAPNNTTLPANVSTQRSAGADVSIENLDVSVREGGNFSVTFRQNDDPVADDAPNFTGPNGTNVAPIQYIRVNKTTTNENIANASFVFRVSKVQLKESGVAPEDLAIYRFVDGEWVELPTTLLEERRTHFVYAALTPGFSDFATGAKKPDFDITRAVIPPGSVTVKSIVLGDSVDIVVEITNEKGAADGTFTAKLLLDGQVVAQRDVTIAAGGTRQVRFSRTFDSAGTFTVLVNDETAGSVEVSEPGSGSGSDSNDGTAGDGQGETARPLRVETPGLSATDVTVGETVTVSVDVTNPSETNQSRALSLRVNNVTVDDVVAGVAAGETREVTFTYTFDRTGTFDVAVGSTRVGTVTVSEAESTPTPTPDTSEPRASFDVADATLSATSAGTGEAVEITATVENTGDASGTYEATLVVNGVSVATQTVELGAGETAQVTFERSFENGGTFSVAVDDVTAGEVVVSTPTPASTPTATQTPTPEGEVAGGVFSPGFAPGLAVLALLAFALLARRRER